jgi:hypothetical protein
MCPRPMCPRTKFLGRRPLNDAPPPQYKGWIIREWIVRGRTAGECIFQGTHRSRTFVRGHTGQGQIYIASKNSTEKMNTKTPPSANTCSDNVYLPFLPLLVFFSLCGGKGLPIVAIRGRRWRLIQRQPKSLRFFTCYRYPWQIYFSHFCLKVHKIENFVWLRF